MEALNTQLLMWVTALKATRDHPLEIPDSPTPVPVLPLVLGPESVLVEIDDGVDTVLENQ